MKFSLCSKARSCVFILFALLSQSAFSHPLSEHLGVLVQSLNSLPLRQSDVRNIYIYDSKSNLSIELSEREILHRRRIELESLFAGHFPHLEKAHKKLKVAYPLAGADLATPFILSKRVDSVVIFDAKPFVEKNESWLNQNNSAFIVRNFRQDLGLSLLVMGTGLGAFDSERDYLMLGSELIGLSPMPTVYLGLLRLRDVLGATIESVEPLEAENFDFAWEIQFSVGGDKKSIIYIPNIYLTSSQKSRVSDAKLTLDQVDLMQRKKALWQNLTQESDLVILKGIPGLLGIPENLDFIFSGVPKDCQVLSDEGFEDIKPAFAKSLGRFKLNWGHSFGYSGIESLTFSAPAETFQTILN